MRGLLFLCALAALPAGVTAQVPQKDSVARADSAARADSIAIVRELEGQAAAVDTAAPAQQRGPLNARLLPDISVVGDMIADFSPKGSTQEGGARLGIREVELAFQAAVDPYFRGDVFIGLSDEEGAAIEQAYLTATALPYQLEARVGRFFMPVGKQITTHRHDLHTIEYPYVIQRFFGPEGLKGTGVYASRVFSPFGFYQELIGTVVDRFGEQPEQTTSEASPNEKLGGLGYSARLRNYWDFSEAANLEVSFSGVTGRREQPLLSSFQGMNAINARQSVVGADITYRWRPLQQGLYKSFIAQVEVMRQSNETPVIPAEYREPDGSPIGFAGPMGNFTGGYAFARYQTSRRTFIAARYDFVEDPDRDGTNMRAASGYFTFFPSEFSKLVAGYERFIPRGDERSLNRFVIQATFALGPHKPHPF
jgi:hypothetical protein